MSEWGWPQYVALIGLVWMFLMHGGLFQKWRELNGQAPVNFAHLIVSYLTVTSPLHIALYAGGFWK